MNRYAQVAAILADAQTQIKSILSSTDDQHHQLKISHSLQREIEYISMITGAIDIQPEVRQRPGPATTMGGKPIQREQRVTKDDLEPNERRVEELRNKVETAYATFLLTDSKELLTKYDHMVIRGVAKKAHMNYTKDNPEKITLQTISEIKEAIRIESDRMADIERDNSGVKIHAPGDVDIENILSEDGDTATLTAKSSSKNKSQKNADSH